MLVGALLAATPVAAFETPWAGLEGNALIAEVGRTAARGQAPLSYRELWFALEETDADPEDPARVILFYSGRSHPKDDKLSSTLNADGRTRNSWNREHVWPRNRGFRRERDLAHNDLHHVRATDGWCNERRGSRDFAAGGRPLDGCAARSTDRTFEPRDQVKGDVARMLFYMDVRYNGDGRTPDLQLVDGTGTSGTELGRLCTLLAWHEQDPPDAFEQVRHERIADIQGNRNPFVDDPSLPALVYAGRC
ncbi:MAG: endonuclease [Pseudomonadota bacterium]